MPSATRALFTGSADRAVKTAREHIVVKKERRNTKYFLSFFTTMSGFVSECARLHYQIALFYVILTTGSFLYFSLYGADVSALRALLYPPRLL